MAGITFPGRRKALIAAAVVVAAVAGGAGYAAASTHHPDPNRSQGVSAAVTADPANVSAGGPCKVGYDTETNSLTPPDDSTTDNTPAGTVSFRKGCIGVVIARFDGEYNGSDAGNFIHMDLRATCTGTGGLSNACTVGQQVFAQPGHTFLQTGGNTVGTRSAQWAFPALGRGVWTFDALPGGDGTAFLGFRTLTVEAWHGG